MIRSKKFNFASTRQAAKLLRVICTQRLYGYMRVDDFANRFSVASLFVSTYMYTYICTRLCILYHNYFIALLGMYLAVRGVVSRKFTFCGWKSLELSLAFNCRVLVLFPALDNQDIASISCD